jgi:uncharacterized protein YeaO (DUF488 family)
LGSLTGFDTARGSGALLQRKQCGGNGARATILTKRAYEAPAASDGYRVLVDRLWPRGLPKTKARLDAWEKDVAPSRRLREWYGHDRDKWPEFRRRYLEELRAPSAQAMLDDLARRARRGRVTLVHASKNPETSAVAVLEQLLGSGCAAGAISGPQCTAPGRSPPRRRSGGGRV